MNAFTYAGLFLFVLLVEVYLGSLVILASDAILATDWLKPIKPTLVRATALGPILFVGFLPLAWLAPTIYPWGHHAADPGTFRAFYLSAPGFAVRGALYFALWILLARLLRRPSAARGGFGLVLLLFTGTLASVDWLQSLDQDFHSTIFGLIFLGGAVTLALAVAILRDGANGPNHARRHQGSVLLSSICTWTYLNVMQLIVIWSGNLPEESRYYIDRSQGMGFYLLWSFGVLQFAFPFFLLLQRPVKESAATLKLVAGLTALEQALFVVWLLGMPTAPAGAAALATSLAGVYYLPKKARRA